MGCLHLPRHRLYFGCHRGNSVPRGGSSCLPGHFIHFGPNRLPTQAAARIPPAQRSELQAFRQHPSHRLLQPCTLRYQPGLLSRSILGLLSERTLFFTIMPCRTPLICDRPLQMVFVGPASREDAGFDHSYDVLVDTYQAAEDLSDPDDYRMGGRMAHHMLYSALQEHPCYDGYLWAPFDTLLNVPRLQLFDQNKFWYHSPFGRYVPNRALDPSAIRNASFHAPPANISPDPHNMTTPWKGWGDDWWYVTFFPLFFSFGSSHSPRAFFFFWDTYRWG